MKTLARIKRAYCENLVLRAICEVPVWMLIGALVIPAFFWCLAWTVKWVTTWPWPSL
jgi:hypothetical protein